ncbi:SDR family oxidoreductase [Geothrix sp. 21YS21S-2]|uniref:SDR family oxidoreductase n=1 Tax=Geothrix sp. 21YS21S-2 TaxID=3068893 RepID=UPI0027B9BE20|nr:SDR family oxidoreductase [Geothrix sp. 21YS21S-2]
MNNLILLTGATGYVGGRLLRALEREGHALRCLVRQPGRLQGRVGPATQVVAGDVLENTGLGEALEGVEVAYYLVHSMGSAGEFEADDRLAAQNFGAAARDAGVRRIIYLGGLGHTDAGTLSPHLRSRQEVGAILRESGVPVLEFRASIVLGSGSLSFELIRALVERLPLMITPRWVSVLAQPIAIEDLVAYLLAAIPVPMEGSRVFEIGGADRVTYGDIMRAYARQRGIRLLMIPVPFLTPYLSSLWLGLVTPVYARIGRKLINSIRHPSLVVDDRALRHFAVRPMSAEEAIRRALVHEDAAYAGTRWSDALSSSGRTRTWGGVRFGTRLVDTRTLSVAARPAQAFAAVQRIGGATGWYACNALWRLRGALDLLAGGVGMRRGRAHPEDLRVGDAVDFWRVEALEPGRLVRLSAEMKLPGRAWLEFEVTPDGEGCTLRQTAIFDPVGFWGQAYWYALFPVHQVVFARMLRGIGRHSVGA